MTLPEISQEQNDVIKELYSNNVIVDSVAGSGKTTCNLHVAKHFPNLNILLLTYNAKLKLETREKVKENQIDNLETQSYHSFCVRHYDKKSYKDENIRMILDIKKSPIMTFDYDIIIVDEAQDVSPLYFELIYKIYNDNKKKAKICIMGDQNQSIFDFNFADERFIVFADKIFDFNNLLWKSCKLSRSFRITYEMSLFINNCMFNNDRIKSMKVSGNRPRYMIIDPYGDESFNEVKYYLNLGYLPEEIFILAPSVKSSNSPISILENKIKLEMKDVQIYVPVSDEEKLDEEILKGKLVFSTFHQTKGLERKVIIVFGFDNSYFKFYKKHRNTSFCPNELYVAVTRGSEKISLFHSADYLPFLNKEKLEEFCDVFYYKEIDIKINSIKPLGTSPTDLIKHLPYNIINECFSLLNVEVINTKKEIIDIPLKTIQDNGCESVCELTGIAIPSYVELRMMGHINIYNRLMKNDFKTKIKNIKTKYDLELIDIKNITSKELLYISNCWNTNTNDFLFKLFQIQEYDWLSQENMIRCADRLENTLNMSKDAIFEKEIKCTLKPNFLNNYVDITGYMDCVDDDNVYEFKCVQMLSKEHHLQLAIYMFMNEREKNQSLEDIKIEIKIEEKLLELISPACVFYKEKMLKLESLYEKRNRIKISNYFLYNIITDELIKISCEMTSLIKMMDILIYKKYLPSKPLADVDFISEMNEIKKKYYR
jgi:hypothetical protein